MRLQLKKYAKGNFKNFTSPVIMNYGMAVGCGVLTLS
jgi:hypothetical protein